MVHGRSLNRSEAIVKEVTADHSKAVDDLNKHSREAQKLQDNTEEKQAQVLHIKHSDLRGRVIFNNNTHDFTYFLFE